MRWYKWLLLVLILLSVIYFVGPHPAKPVYSMTMPAVPALPALPDYISQNEAQHLIKPGNAAQIVWLNDSLKNKTDYSLVYLHGFSASHEEGNPVHRNIARKFGCNLYLSRLSQHGIDTSEQLMNLTADNYWESAKQALAIGRQLGSKVILMGTSTGATQALQLAAAFPEQVSAIVLYSPNIAINDPNAWLLNDPWGLQIARLVKSGNYQVPSDQRPEYLKYWNSPYRLEAVVALEEMLETSMNQVSFKKIKQPALMLYYYKDEAHQDKVVKVSAMLEMFETLGTPANQKRAVPIPKAGDHVIASPIKSADVVSVEKATEEFFEQILVLKPVMSDTAHRKRE
jgi:pimeloyl-ACP methyl ester carboxylesterase